MFRTNSSPRPLNALFNGVQAVQGRGGQIDWSKVSTYFTKGKFNIQLNGAVARGAVSLTVDPLLYPIDNGTVLDFGTEASVVVTFGAALINATTVPVTALSGAIPSGAILKTPDSQEFVQLTAPAAAGATTLAVEAIPNALEGGETATYLGGHKLAEVTADVAAGATAIPVVALEFAIADDSTAIADFTGTGDKKIIPALTVMARTSAGKLIPRHDATSETASELLQSDAQEGSVKDAKSGYGTYIECQVYENLLPDADATTGDIPAGYKTELAANGARINFLPDYNDSRAV